MSKKRGEFIVIVGNNTNNFFTKNDDDKHYIVCRSGSAGEETLKNGVFGNQKGDKYNLADAITISEKMSATYRFVGSSY